MLEPQQHGIAQAPQRAAAFHPIGGIEHLDRGLVLARLQMRHETLHAFGSAKCDDGRALFVAQRPETPAERDLRLHVLDALFREMLPTPLKRLLQHGDHRFGRVDPLLFLVWPQGILIAVHQVLDEVRGRDAREVGAARRRRQRQAEPDQVVRGVADHGLVEVADQDRHVALGVGHRPEIADMAVAADPDRRTVGNAVAVRLFKPFVELDRGAAHIGVGGAGHLQPLMGEQYARTF
jgi:hypothetical protein